MNKNKIYIISIIFGVVVLALICLAVLLFLEIKNQSESLTLGKNSAAILQTQSDQIEVFKKSYPDYQPNLQKMHQLFVDPQNPVEFIKFLEKEASGSGITPKISLSGLQEDKNVVTFQLYSTGDFLKILYFSEKLENGPYLVQIKNVAIKSLPEQNNPKNSVSENVEVTFTIHVFVAPK